MNRRQQNEAQALIRSSEFAATRVPDFTHQPATPVDLKCASARTRLTTAITDLGGKQAIQAGGAFGQQTEDQGILRDELEEELRDINLTAASIAEETANPALGNRAEATAAIPVALRSGKGAIKTLNAIFRRVYKGNIEVLTAWRTASHVQRDARSTAPVIPPAVP